MTEVEILNRYPIIFKEKDLSPQESTMHWGLEVPIRWLRYIDDVCRVLQSYRDKSIEYKDKIPFPQFIAEQVKTKFGTPRFYYRLEWDDVDNCEITEDDIDVAKIEYRNFIYGVLALMESQIINEEKQFREQAKLARQ